MAQGDSLGDQPGATEALLVDCLRCAGRADKALEVIGFAERGECEPIIRTILAFQRRLIEQGDVTCHTVGEALRERR